MYVFTVCLYVFRTKRIMQVDIKNKNIKLLWKMYFFYLQKTVSRDIMPIANQRGNRLYATFGIKVAFFSLCCIFKIFLLIPAALAWCEERVIVVLTILRSVSKNILKLEFYKKPYSSALWSINSMPWSVKCL